MNGVGEAKLSGAAYGRSRRLALSAASGSLQQRKLSTPAMGARRPNARRRFSHVTPPPCLPPPPPPPAVSSRLESGRRRLHRLSHVGAAVGRKLSSTLGWSVVSPTAPTTSAKIAEYISDQDRRTCCGLPAAGAIGEPCCDSVETVMRHTRCLISQMIRCRVSRICRQPLDRRVYLQRLGSLPRLAATADIGRVFRQLQLLASQLERLRPAVYSCVSRQLNAPLVHRLVPGQLTQAVATNLFAQPSAISWAKVASMCVVVSCLAVECVDIGHPEYIQTLVDSMGTVACGDMGLWIVEQGGWSAILDHYEAQPSAPSVVKIIVRGAAGLLGVALLLVVCLSLLSRIFAEKLNTAS